MDGVAQILTPDERRLMFSRANSLRNRSWLIVSLFGLLFLVCAVAEMYPSLQSSLMPVIKVIALGTVGYLWLNLVLMNKCPRCGKFYLGHFMNPRLARFQHPPVAHYPAQCSRCGVYFFEDLTEKSAKEFHALMVRQQLGRADSRESKLTD